MTNLDEIESLLSNTRKYIYGPYTVYKPMNRRDFDIFILKFLDGGKGAEYKSLIRYPSVRIAFKDNKFLGLIYLYEGEISEWFGSDDKIANADIAEFNTKEFIKNIYKSNNFEVINNKEENPDLKVLKNPVPTPIDDSPTWFRIMEEKVDVTGYEGRDTFNYKLVAYRSNNSIKVKWNSTVFATSNDCPLFFKSKEEANKFLKNWLNYDIKDLDIFITTVKAMPKTKYLVRLVTNFGDCYVQDWKLDKLGLSIDKTELDKSQNTNSDTLESMSINEALKYLKKNR